MPHLSTPARAQYASCTVPELSTRVVPCPRSVRELYHARAQYSIGTIRYIVPIVPCPSSVPVMP
eukprot:3691748-Rhodomonas_salina.1